MMIAGFIDQASASLGIIRRSNDGGKSWGNDTVIDSSAWLTSPIIMKPGSNTTGLVLAGEACHGFATSDAGASWSKVPICGGWLADRFTFRPDGAPVVVGTSYCVSPPGIWPPKFKCADSVDSDGDAAPLYFSDPESVELIAGGIISPQVAGWVHLSTDGGHRWGARASFQYPIRDTAAINAWASPVGQQASTHPLLLAAGGDFQSGVGGLYSSTDGGSSWAVEVDTAAEQFAVAEAPLGGGRNSRYVYTAGCAKIGGRIHRALISPP